LTSASDVIVLSTNVHSMLREKISFHRKIILTSDLLEFTAATPSKFRKGLNPSGRFNPLIALYYSYIK
jgi:hypothetical protein